MTSRCCRSLLIFIAACMTLLSGCVLAPVSRTYFEPNVEDGEARASQSCGYHRAAKDALDRKIDEVTLSVLPHYEKDQPLRIYVHLSRTQRTIEVDPNKIEVRVDTSDTAFSPEKVEARDGGPYFFKSIAFTFPSGTAQAQEISIVFLPGFLTLDGVTTAHRPFRFRKVTKFDIYYSSINC